MLNDTYRLVLAFVAGALAVLAFAPFSQGWVAVLSLAALFALWRNASPAQAFRLGWFWGLGCMGFGVFWLHNSIAQFGGVNLPLAILLTLLFTALLAFFPAMAGWLSRRNAYRISITSVQVAPEVFCAFKAHKECIDIRFR